MFNRVIFNLVIATEAIFANKIRAGLTALGIIFGVAAVIAMLAVGNGAQQEILEQIKLVGVNNIVITPIVKKKDAGNDPGTATGKPTKEKFSPGLTLADAEGIKDKIPGVRAVSPEVMIEANVIKDGLQRPGKLIGVEPQYFDIINFRVERGQAFSPRHLITGAQVCIIGRGVQTKFFSKEDPLGKFLKVGKHWLKVIGIMESRGVSESAISNLGIRNYDMDIYTPVQTVLLRYTNRTILTKAMIQQANSDQNNNNDGSKKKNEPVNYHQLDRLVVQVGETDQLNATADIISRMLERRHFKVPDYEISIPELLLKQQQRTKDIFNIVLGVIAGISLLVGGIGIMNIMLASVLERIKEIGLRISLGAKKQDIVLQFLCEATLISVAGGVTGIILGVVLANIIANVAEIPTIISFWSIFISFFVAASVGIVFGLLPARRAAQQDPITSLRYE